jgi:hypothetical protein
VTIAAPFVGVWALIAVGLTRLPMPPWVALALGFGGGLLAAACAAVLSPT